MNKKILFFVIIFGVLSLSVHQVGYAASSTASSAEELTTLATELTALEKSMAKISPTDDADDESNTISALKEIVKLQTSLKALDSLSSSSKTYKNAATKLTGIKSLLTTSGVTAALSNDDLVRLLIKLKALKSLAALVS